MASLQLPVMVTEALMGGSVACTAWTVHKTWDEQQAMEAGQAGCWHTYAAGHAQPAGRQASALRLCCKPLPRRTCGLLKAPVSPIWPSSRMNRSRS